MAREPLGLCLCSCQNGRFRTNEFLYENDFLWGICDLYLIVKRDRKTLCLLYIRFIIDGGYQCSVTYWGPWVVKANLCPFSVVSTEILVLFLIPSLGKVGRLANDAFRQSAFQCDVIYDVSERRS